MSGHGTGEQDEDEESEDVQRAAREAHQSEGPEVHERPGKETGGDEVCKEGRQHEASELQDYEGQEDHTSAWARGLNRDADHERKQGVPQGGDEVREQDFRPRAEWQLHSEAFVDEDEPIPPQNGEKPQEAQGQQKPLPSCARHVRPHGGDHLAQARDVRPLRVVTFVPGPVEDPREYFHSSRRLLSLPSPGFRAL